VGQNGRYPFSLCLCSSVRRPSGFKKERRWAKQLPSLMVHARPHMRIPKIPSAATLAHERWFIESTQFRTKHRMLFLPIHDAILDTACSATVQRETPNGCPDADLCSTACATLICTVQQVRLCSTRLCSTAGTTVQYSRYDCAAQQVRLRRAAGQLLLGMCLHLSI
jgi:hypothetical protein